MIRFGIFLTLITFLFVSNGYSQKVDPNHKLLWRISSTVLEEDSYIYGTMHLRDPRVFNFSDSVYVKIEACKHFALEVHPDTMIKTMIVDPFNTEINRNLDEYLDSEYITEINEELKEKTGIELDGISKDNEDVIPWFLDKIFKKNKDKNTFLDAHLYHIAKILGRNVVGLETIEDHKTALRTFSDDEKPDVKKMMKIKSMRKLFLEDMIKNYEDGNIEALYQSGGYASDSILAYRNEIMVNTSLQYIEDGGLFMAVGAAHLAGEQGMLELLREQGYTVEPVTARFSKKMINAELANKELPWVKETYPDEGFSVTIPDRAYNYLPESMVGVYKVRSYPDLGLGHFFIYSVFPIIVEDYTLDMLETEVRNRIESRGAEVVSKQIKQQTYEGSPMIEIKYKFKRAEVVFRYIMRNSYLYSFGISKMGSGKIDDHLVEKYFSNIKFFDVQERKRELYKNEQGAFELETNLLPQYYQEVENSDGVHTTTEYVNFFDQNSKLLHMVSYTTYGAGTMIEDSDYILESYYENFLGETDSLVYSRTGMKYGGTEIHIEFDDQTFAKALAFMRGNRFYQVITSGSSSPVNYEKASHFIVNFDTIGYADFGETTFENENFKTSFPAQPRIDTLTSSYSLKPFAKQAVLYQSLDDNSGMNVWVNEIEIAPYAAYEHIDSFYNEVQDFYLSHNDSLLSCEKFGNDDATVFRLQKINKSSKLRYDVNLFIDGTKLYEVHLIQDSVAINPAAREAFVNSFQLKNKSKSALLFRDSIEVKKLLMKDVNSLDTTLLKTSSKALAKFNFTNEEVSQLFKRYESRFNPQHPQDYNIAMLQFFANQEVDSRAKLLEKIYLTKDVGDALQIAILKMIIRIDNPEAITLAKSLLQHHVPKPAEDWDITSMFNHIHKDFNKLKPLFPELLELGVQDSSVILDHVLYKCLEEEVITYDELSPIHDVINSNAHKYYQEILESDPDDVWNTKTRLVSLAALSSFSKNQEAIKIYEYFFSDSTLYYYKLKGAEFLLRQGIKPDLCSVYDNFSSYSAKLAMYELEREFPEVEVLPDSMNTLTNYAIVASMTYVEEEYYFEDATSDLVDSYEKDGHMHYFIECTFSSSYESDEVETNLLIYTVLDLQDGPFSAPEYLDVYSNYYYLEDHDLVKPKQELINHYIEVSKE